MILRKLMEKKNSQATWLLVIVLFLSGFSFSLSTGYAKADHVKAKTELVVSGKTKSKKSFFYGQYASSFAPVAVKPSFSTSYFINFQNSLYRILFNAVNKAHQDFVPLITARYFLLKTPEDNFADLLG